MKNTLISVLVLLTALSSCVGNKESNQKPIEIEENAKAKQMLQGIWVNEDAGDVVFKIKGDTIFYPDTTSMPVYFQVMADTLVLHGANSVKYPIIKQTEHVFVFANQNSEQVKLMKSEDPNDGYLFEGKKPRPLNQNQLIKRDTIVVNGADRYHCYVQVNPTTYKVVKSTYNDEGVAVDNIYHDNIIHLSIFKGTAKLWSGNIRKQQFTEYVPKQFLDQAILSDLIYNKVDAQGIHYLAVFGTGDSNVSYEINVTVGFDGKMTMSAM